MSPITNPTMPFPLREEERKVIERQAFQPNLNISLMCQDCKTVPPVIVEEFSQGDLVCGECGLVLGDRIIDTRSEWRTFANDEGDDPSRVGAASNPLLDGDQLDTIISRRDGGTGVARDLNRTQGRAVAHKQERNLMESYKQITVFCDSISLSKITSDTAKQLYKRIEDEKILRGRPHDAIIATCIFVACRQEKNPRTYKEISALTRVNKKEIGRCIAAMKKKLQTDTTVMSSEDLMARFCSNLGLPNHVQKAGISLVRETDSLGTLAGKSPISIAAACIYLVSYLFKNPRSTRDVAQVAGVTESTIKSAYRALYKQKDNLIDLNAWKVRFNCEDISFDELVLS